MNSIYQASLISLPIDAHLDEIINAYKNSPNVILTAPPGSGKTLRVPALLLKNIILNQSTKKIIVLVPKRIAAVSAAYRTAEENNWNIGEQVGYQVRFDNKTSVHTQLIFMTEGVFIKKLSDKKFFNDIHTVIFDEFHERSSQNDIALGICFEKQILNDDTKNQLKILVMSATLDTVSLENFLQNTVHVDVKAPPHSLEIIKNKKAQRLICDYTFIDQMVEVIREAYNNKSKKDILIFMPGLHEIRLLQNRINQTFPTISVDILHGTISLEEQKRILSATNYRRVIISTNIAESSLTLPSVDCVIDSGLEKKSIIESKIGFSRLELKRISLFSAQQRAGRAARVGPGVCFQLWHESDERSMSQEIEPEILKSNLLEESLILLAADINNPDQFSWLTKPKTNFTSALSKLKKWRLVNEQNKITEFGSGVQKMPLDIEKSVLFIELYQLGFKQEACRFLAFLETTDFSKISFEQNLTHFSLNDLGRRIENQLSQTQLKTNFQTQDDFKAALIKTYLKYFPEKMAQVKDEKNALSSLGRGIQFSTALAATPLIKNCDFCILMAGRDISDSTTQIDFAIGFSQKEFEQFSKEEQTIETTYQVDFEKKSIYKIEKKLSGLFVISESSKIKLDSLAEKKVFSQLLAEQSLIFLEKHTDWPAYLKKINFLKNRSDSLGYPPDYFDFMTDLAKVVIENINGTLHSIEEFLNFDLTQLLIYLTPDTVKNDLIHLPYDLKMPNGKSILIDYQSEKAPVISVKIQDILGMKKHPTILKGRIALTIELLAPNYRPTQITGNLEQFWLTSYQDIRKELRARYPKHDWPEDPTNWTVYMSRKFRKEHT